MKKISPKFKEDIDIIDINKMCVISEFPHIKTFLEKIGFKFELSFKELELLNQKYMSPLIIQRELLEVKRTALNMDHNGKISKRYN